MFLLFLISENISDYILFQKIIIDKVLIIFNVFLKHKIIRCFNFVTFSNFSVKHDRFCPRVTILKFF